MKSVCTCGYQEFFIKITIIVFFIFVDYMEYAMCFEENDMYNRFGNYCRLIAEYKASQEPGYDYCKSVVFTKQLLLHFIEVLH